MAETKKGRRIVDALDDLTAELRLSNQIAALEMGAAALEHDTGAKGSSSALTKSRVARRNALRAAVRTVLGIEEVTGDVD